MRVLKYILPSDDTVVAMPVQAQILTIEVQGETPVVWVLVNNTEIHTSRRIKCVNTGDEIDSSIIKKYINTFSDGGIVWHAFEVNL